MSLKVLSAYGLQDAQLQITPFGSGLINHTWKVSSAGQQYILQRINDAVFKDPYKIAHNIKLIGDYLSQQYPDYTFVTPVKTNDGDEMVYCPESGFFRLFPFVSNSHSKDVVQTAEQAYEAALQFGRFTHKLSGFNADQLQVTLPHFHNLSLRYQQFLKAFNSGNKQRIKECETQIREIEQHSKIVSIYEHIITNPEFKTRVTHHDTKISNVLFNKADKGICVIDLDTIMPGYFISDVGDMMRTYLSPSSEEETDFSLIEVRDDFYKAILQGYCDEMKDDLTETEKQYFFYAGAFLIYMQAIRFLIDHINDDIYYGAKYTDHNLNRAKNQLMLLTQLMKKENILKEAKYYL